MHKTVVINAVGLSAKLLGENTPRISEIVRAGEMHEADYSPWEGRDLAAWPSLTMLRGKVMVENGELRGALTDGKFLPRQIPQEIRTRPAV